MINYYIIRIKDITLFIASLPSIQNHICAISLPGCCVLTLHKVTALLYVSQKVQYLIQKHLNKAKYD